MDWDTSFGSLYFHSTVGPSISILDDSFNFFPHS